MHNSVAPEMFILNSKNTALIERCIAGLSSVLFTLEGSKGRLIKDIAIYFHI